MAERQMVHIELGEAQVILVPEDAVPHYRRGGWLLYDEYLENQAAAEPEPEAAPRSVPQADRKQPQAKAAAGEDK